MVRGLFYELRNSYTNQLVTIMANLINLSTTRCFNGFNTRYGYLGQSEASAALTAFLGRGVTPNVVLAATEAVARPCSSSINYRWVVGTGNEYEAAPYIASLMWAHMYSRAGLDADDFETILRLEGLPAYWGAGTVQSVVRLLRSNVNNPLEFIRSLTEEQNARGLREVLMSATLYQLRSTRVDTVADLVTALNTPQEEVVENLPSYRPRPAARPAVSSIEPLQFGPLFRWDDLEGPPNTYLQVDGRGCVTYKYNGSYGDSGTGDTRAVRRAIRAWRAWEKPEDVSFWCIPARPRLREFYRLFPEVTVR